MKLNCAVVALALWYRASFRSGIVIKRSEGLYGLIPHFLHLRERKAPKDRHGSTIVLVDYIPRRRKSGCADPGDSFVLFDGIYRVRIYRQVAVSTGDSLFSAYRSAALFADTLYGKE